jgi:hypothetical protein
MRWKKTRPEAIFDAEAIGTRRSAAKSPNMCSNTFLSWASYASTTLFGATRLWDPATGLGYGDEFAGSKRLPGSLTSSIDLPFLGLRNAFSPDGKLLAVESRRARCCGTSIPRSGAGVHVRSQAETYPQ